MLHIVSDSPFTHTSLERCLQYVSNADTIVLIGDAVIAANATKYSAKLIGKNVVALSDDLNARGLSANYGNLISYDEFVALVVASGSPISW